VSGVGSRNVEKESGESYCWCGNWLGFGVCKFEVGESGVVYWEKRRTNGNQQVFALNREGRDHVNDFDSNWGFAFSPAAWYHLRVPQINPIFELVLTQQTSDHNRSSDSWILVGSPGG